MTNLGRYFGLISSGWDAITDILADIFVGFMTVISIIFLWPVALLGWWYEKSHPSD